MNAMHVWEVVLARFEINDLNMCYIVENHQKEKCRQKHLQYSHARATDGETTRTARHSLEKSFVKKGKKKTKTRSFNTKCQLLEKSRALLLLEI